MVKKTKCNDNELNQFTSMEMIFEKKFVEQRTDGCKTQKRSNWSYLAQNMNRKKIKCQSNADTDGLGLDFDRKVNDFSNSKKS